MSTTRTAPTLEVPHDCAPGNVGELTDLLFAVWTGNERVLAQHREVAKPRLRARAYRALTVAAKAELEAVEAKWAEVYASGSVLDTALITEACLARQRAIGKVTALSYEPPAVAKNPLIGTHLLRLHERARDVSYWCLAMIEAALVPEEFMKHFTWAARLAQGEADYAEQAKEALEPYGTADAYPRRQKMAREVIASQDSARKRALDLIGSAANKGAAS